MSWGRRIRAAVGMGFGWGAAWALGGMVLARLPGFDSDLPFALLFAALGVACGILFFALLVLVERRRSLETVPLWFLAGCGATSGLLLSGLITSAAALRGADAWGEWLLFGPPLTVASALCAAGSRVVARWRSR